MCQRCVGGFIPFDYFLSFFCCCCFFLSRRWFWIETTIIIRCVFFSSFVLDHRRRCATTRIFFYSSFAAFRWFSIKILFACCFCFDTRGGHTIRVCFVCVCKWYPNNATTWNGNICVEERKIRMNNSIRWFFGAITCCHITFRNNNTF